MSDDTKKLGRRRLLVLGAGAAAIPACGPTNAYPTFDPTGLGDDGGGSGTPTSGSGPSTSGGSISDLGSSSGSSSSGGSSGSSSGGRKHPGATSGSSGGGSSGSTGSSGGGDDGGSVVGDDASTVTDPSSSSSGSSGGSFNGGSSSGSSSGGSSSSSSSSGGSSGGGTTCPTSSQILTLSFSQYPALKNVGGSATVSANGYSDPNCARNQIIVVCKAAGQYVALSTSCTHQCCAVSLVSVSSGFRCPCHGATFDISGRNTSSIAPKPLPSLAVCSDSTGVHVTL